MTILEGASFGVEQKKKRRVYENTKVSARNFNWLIMPSEAQGFQRRCGAGKGEGKSTKSSRSAERDLDSLPQSVQQLLLLYVWQR